MQLLLMLLLYTDPAGVHLWSCVERKRHSVRDVTALWVVLPHKSHIMNECLCTWLGLAENKLQMHHISMLMGCMRLQITLAYSVSYTDIQAQMAFEYLGSYCI